SEDRHRGACKEQQLLSRFLVPVRDPGPDSSIQEQQLLSRFRHSAIQGPRPSESCSWAPQPGSMDEDIRLHSCSGWTLHPCSACCRDLQGIEE
ncbi:hypothetical protein NDU88_003292, partial [Pleurodeles waltl]